MKKLRTRFKLARPLKSINGAYSKRDTDEVMRMFGVLGRLMFELYKNEMRLYDEGDEDSLAFDTILGIVEFREKFEEIVEISMWDAEEAFGYGKQVMERFEDFVNEPCHVEVSDDDSYTGEFFDDYEGW